MSKPLLDYYPMETLAARLGCNIKDILAFAASGKLLLSISYTGRVSAPGQLTGSFGDAFVWCVHPDEAKLFLFNDSVNLSTLVRAYTNLEDGTRIPCDNKFFSPVHGDPNKNTPTFRREHLYVLKEELLKFEEENLELLKDISETSLPRKTGLSNYDSSSSLSPKRRQSSSEKSIQVQHGTEWSDIQIKFLSDKEIIITIGKEKPIKRTYKSFGFSFNSKSKKPRLAWYHLLELAVYKGCPRSDSKLTVKKVSDLQKALRGIFPSVDGNPFESYSKSEKGWPPRINISISEQLAREWGIVG